MYGTIVVMLFGKHKKKIQIIWAVVSVIVALGMILLYMAPMFS